MADEILIIVEDTNPDVIVYVEESGLQGAPGSAGVGVPAGGTSGQVLKKQSGTDYDTIWQNEAASFQSDVAGVVIHGATAGTARLTGFANVIWIGSVEPTNAIDNDIWIDTT